MERGPAAAIRHPAPRSTRFEPRIAEPAPGRSPGASSVPSAWIQAVSPAPQLHQAGSARLEPHQAKRLQTVETAAVHPDYVARSENRLGPLPVAPAA